MNLADEIGAVVPTLAGRQTWWSKLPAEAAAELLEVRSRFQAGGYGDLTRHRLGELLHQSCKSRGWRTCDARRFSEWLAKND